MPNLDFSTTLSNLLMRFTLLFPLLVILLATSCSVRPRQSFSDTPVPLAPDYSQPDAWAALPQTSDAADATPADLPNMQAEAAADVFFLHPTTYTGKKGHRLWNGPVDDPDLIARTDSGTIKFQASIFNGAGRVFAPRYRQVHLQAYYTKDQASARQAFALAYSDIKAAFEYYLEHYHDGRPLIIASHSQGTTHAKRLLTEYFDDFSLREKLVAAYLVGIAVAADAYDNLPPCRDAEQTGCIISWRTYREGVSRRNPKDNILVTNPLSWTTNNTPVPAAQNPGAVLRDFSVIHRGVCGAQVADNVLWVEKPHDFPGSFFFWTKNYHIADYNLFYLSIRENARMRVDAFLAKAGIK